MPRWHRNYLKAFKPLANRNSLLVYTESRTTLEESQSGEGEILYQSPHGVPLLWVFAFGERNVWDPGDDINARGGAVGARNPYETMVEIAATRLEHAESALANSAPLLWPWLSAMSIFKRKLYALPKTGFIRIVAPWMLSLKDKEINRWRAATAFAENCVHYLMIGRNMHATESLRELKPFCPFVPYGSPRDVKGFRSIKAYPEQSEHMRVAFLTLGEPVKKGPYQQAVDRDIAQALAQYYENIENMSQSSTRVPKLDTAAATDDGLISRLAGIFRRK